MEASMGHSQAAACVDRFPSSAAIMKENRVSFSVGKDDETKYWEGEQCEVVGERTYDEGQEWMTSSSNSSRPEYEDQDDQDLRRALAMSEEDLRMDGQLDDQDLQIALAMSEGDPRMDGELAKRLSELDSVPHVPKVNAEIPLTEVSSDKQRLQDRLSSYRLAEKKIPGDGNCQFRALSDQLYRTPDHHMQVRRMVVKQLASEPDSYSGYVPMEYNKYLKNMSKYGEWGDHVTLQAAADFYGVKISLITTFKESGFIEISPAQEKSNRGVYLSFWSEVHYNSIYAIEDDVSFTKKKKKPWYSFLG